MRQKDKMILMSDEQRGKCRGVMLEREETWNPAKGGRIHEGRIGTNFGDVGGRFDDDDRRRRSNHGRIEPGAEA